MTSEKEITQIQHNWEQFLLLIEKKVVDATTRDALLALCKETEDRLAACAASTRLEYVGAFPGGLVWHSLNVLKTMNDLNKVYKADCSTDSLIVTALFHDIGKIGDQEHDMYLPQESDWHRDRGMMFEVNKSVTNVPVAVRTLWWLNSAGVPLSQSEIHAISSLQHMNHMYSSELYNVPMLTMMLQQSVRFCCLKNGGKTSVLDD